MQIPAHSSALIGCLSVTGRGTVEVLHCWALAVCASGKMVSRKLSWIHNNILITALLKKRDNNISKQRSVICVYVGRVGFFPSALLQFHPELCAFKPSHASRLLHKVHRNTLAFGVALIPTYYLLFVWDVIGLHNCDMMEFRRNSHFLLRTHTCPHFSISRKCRKICFKWHTNHAMRFNQTS